jgi:hypothetical protein
LIDPRTMGPIMLPQLPSDILRVHLFPYLDYDSRMSLNQTLPSYDRYVRPISLNDRLAHDIGANLAISQNIVLRTSAVGQYKKLCMWRDYCGHILAHRISSLIQCRSAMRIVLLDKMKEFSNHLTTRGVPSMSACEQMELIQRMNQVYTFIQALPHLDSVPHKPYCVQ